MEALWVWPSRQLPSPVPGTKVCPAEQPSLKTPRRPQAQGNRAAATTFQTLKEEPLPTWSERYTGTYSSKMKKESNKQDGTSFQEKRRENGTWM